MFTIIFSANILNSLPKCLECRYFICSILLLLWTSSVDFPSTIVLDYFPLFLGWRCCCKGKKYYGAAINLLWRRLSHRARSRALNSRWFLVGWILETNWIIEKRAHVNWIRKVVFLYIKCLFPTHSSAAASCVGRCR